MTYTTHEGAYPEIQVNDLDELPLDRWRLALARRLEIIKRDPLHAEDSTETGNKYTICTWGMCGEEKAAWPDAQDHTWPKQFEAEGRVAPLDRPEGRLCPMDTRSEASDPEELFNGCFYSCRIFQAKKNQRPTRDEAVGLFEQRIRVVDLSLQAGQL